MRHEKETVKWNNKRKTLNGDINMIHQHDTLKGDTKKSQ